MAKYLAMRRTLIILLTVVATATAQQSLEPTAALVEARLRALKLRTNLSEEQLNQVSAVYRDILDQIKLREDWVKQSEQLKAELDVPTQSQEVDTELKPEYPQNATPEQLQQLYEQATTSLNLARDELTASEQKLKNLTERRKALPEILAEARLRLDGLNKERLESTYPDLDAARQMLRKARIQALTSELQYYEAELLSVPLREKLLTVERETAARKVSRLERLNAEWRAIVAAHTRSEAERLLQTARKDLQELASNPVLKRVAERNLALAEARVRFNAPAKIDQTRNELDSTRQLLTELHESFSRLKDRVAAIGLTDSTGVLLRKKLEELPDSHEYRRRISSRQQELSSAQLRILEFEEELARSAALEERERAELKRYSQLDLEESLKRLSQTRALLLSTQITELNRYFDLIMELDIEQQKLVDEIMRNRRFIEENILWVKTLPTFSLWDLPNSFTFLKSRITTGLFSSSLTIFAENLQQNLLKSLLLIAGALLAVYTLYQTRLKLRGYIARVGTVEAAQPGIDDIHGTIKVFFSTLLLSTFRPMTVLIVWVVLGYIGENSVFVHALARGLQTIIIPYLTTRFLLAFTMPMGLAQAHLEWSDERIATLRKFMRTVNTLVLPATFLVSFLQALNISERDQAVASRIVYILSNLVLAYIIFRLSHPVHGVVYEQQDKDKYWLHMLICAAASLTPLLLALFSAMGYYYAATHLSSLFGKTVLALSYLITLKTVAYSLVIARAAKNEVSTEEQKSLEQFKLQAYRMISHGSTIIFMLFLLFIWTPVIPALTYLNRIELWSTSVEVDKQVVGEDGQAVSRVVKETVSIKLTDLIVCFAIVLITIATARNVPGFIEIVFLQRLPFDAGARYAFTVVSRYIIVTAGLILSAGSLGLKWGHVQWMVAAVSVGLGFGLQEIFSNFISGLIILFERPVRVGDIVTVGETTGTISRIRIRSTTITDYDMKELIIPNKNFITGQVINWTLSTSVSRVTVPIQVAYHTDTEVVVRLLKQAADAVPLVLKEPRPVVLFVGFGQNGLDFKLFFYIPNRDVYVEALSRVNEQINTLFNQNAIEIPYPQRDVHIRSSISPPK